MTRAIYIPGTRCYVDGSELQYVAQGGKRMTLIMSRLVKGHRWWASPGLGRAGPSTFYVMGRDPAQPIEF